MGRVSEDLASCNPEGVERAAVAFDQSKVNNKDVSSDRNGEENLLPCQATGILDIKLQCMRKESGNWVHWC